MRWYEIDTPKVLEHSVTEQEVHILFSLENGALTDVPSLLNSEMSVPYILSHVPLCSKSVLVEFEHEEGGSSYYFESALMVFLEEELKFSIALNTHDDMKLASDMIKDKPEWDGPYEVLKAG